MKKGVRNRKNSRKMPFAKCLVFISLCVLFATLFGGVALCSARAETTSEEASENALNKNVEEQLSQLDLAALEAYLQELGSFGEQSVTERLLSYIRSDAIDYDGFWRQLLTIVFSKATELIPSFACIMAIALLSGLLSALQSGSSGATASGALRLITYVAALIPLLAALTEGFRATWACVDALRTQMQLVFPLMLTLLAASGGGATAAICRPAVAFFSTNIVAIVDSVVLPITVTIVAFSVTGNFTKELKINRFTAFFKSINKWIIGICVSAFGIFFTLQGITAANYDGIVRRAAKYAIGSGVPIIGGFLSGGFDLAVAGSVLIKNALGNMSIFLMIAVVLEPLALLIALNVLLRLTSAISQPLGDGGISDLLGETAENMQYCTAGLLMTAFLYFLGLMLLVYSTEALL